MGNIAVDAWSFESKTYLDTYGVAEMLLGMSWNLADKSDLFYNKGIQSVGED